METLFHLCKSLSRHQSSSLSLYNHNMITIQIVKHSKFCSTLYHVNYLFCPHLSRGILATTKVTVTFCAPDDFHESDGPLNFTNGFWYQMLISWCWLWLWLWIVSPKKIIGRQTKESVKTSRAPSWTVKERSTTKKTIAKMTTMKIRTMIISPWWWWRNYWRTTYYALCCWK